MIQSEKLLQQKCTLTVITNPVSATCTINYNGIDYITKSLSVPSGTTVSYSIYHETYGTQTGTITMDSDKTLTTIGTYSTITTDISWSQPKLSSNGTLGGNSFAVSATSEYSTAFAAWYAFDNNSSTLWQASTTTASYTFYNPIPLKVTRLNLQAYNATGRNLTNGIIYGSDTNSNWTTLTSWSNNKELNFNVSLSNNNVFYKYHRIDFTKVQAAGWTPSLRTLNITAYTQKESYTYYWDVTIS